MQGYFFFHAASQITSPALPGMTNIHDVSVGVRRNQISSAHNARVC